MNGLTRGVRTWARLAGSPVRLGAVLCAGLILASCGSSGSSTEQKSATPTSTAPGGLTTLAFTSPNGDRYRALARGDDVTVTAPKSNETVAPPPAWVMKDADWDDVVSEAFWKTGQPRRTDQRACVTMHSVIDASTREQMVENLKNPGSVGQPGVALRVARRTFDVGTRAIVVRPAIMYGLAWTIDVVGVRTSSEDGESDVQSVELGEIDASDSVGEWTAEAFEPEFPGFFSTMKPPPWNMCAQVVGTTLSVMIWADGADQPNWDDDNLVHRVELPSNWVYQGNAGGYQTRLNPGYTSRFSGLKVSSPY